MKKRRNIVAAFLLSSVMAVSACAMTIPAMTAFASDNTITITLPTNDKATHTYEAYQVFKGDLTGDILTNIQWGDHINSTTLLAKLAADSAFKIASDTDTPAITATSSAAAVAKYLAKYNDAATAQKFADYVSQSLNSTTAITGNFTAASDSTPASAVIDVTNPGYYFVKDKDDSLASVQSSAYTKFILKVVGPAAVNAKEDVPTLDKKIVEGTERVSANTASIGDTITFELTSKVPNMTGYEKYFYVINDDICPGLTFDASSVTVSITTTEDNPETTENEEVKKTLKLKASAEAAETETFVVQTGTDSTKPSEYANGHSFQIILNDFIQYASLAGKPITVTYNAVLNENADRTVIGNPNTVNLTYTNNPNTTYTGVPGNPGNPGNPDEPGSPDEPNTGEPVGVTPDSKTKTYTTGLKLVKVDAKTKNILSGAEFEIKGSGVNSAVIVLDKETYEAAADGEYYKLTDGTYTKTAPADVPESQRSLYADTSTKYKLTSTLTSSKTSAGSDADKKITATVSNDGILIFEGLGAGTYTITETKAPAGGYNKLSEPITVVIDDNNTASLNGITWTVTADSDTISNDAYSNGISVLTVENNKGTTLPSTGGIGTTIFYIIGGTLMAGAVVLLITKKRMTYTDEK